MMLIDIRSNLDAAMLELSDIERTQMPFGTSLALNATIRDIRRHIVFITYPKAFTVRNKSFPNAVFRMKFARKGDLEVELFDALGRDFLERHATGGIKVSGAGGRLAIPMNIKRTATGRIPKARKPRAITAKKSTQIIRGSGGKELIVERYKGETIVRYHLTKSAKIDKTFRFYEDAYRVMDRVIEGHWSSGMNRALRSARIFSAG